MLRCTLSFKVQVQEVADALGVPMAEVLEQGFAAFAASKRVRDAVEAKRKEMEA